MYNNFDDESSGLRQIGNLSSHNLRKVINALKASRLGSEFSDRHKFKGFSIRKRKDCPQQSFGFDWHADYFAPEVEIEGGSLSKSVWIAQMSGPGVIFRYPYVTETEVNPGDVICFDHDTVHRGSGYEGDEEYYYSIFLYAYVDKHKPPPNKVNAIEAGIEVKQPTPFAQLTLNMRVSGRRHGGGRGRLWRRR